MALLLDILDGYFARLLKTSSEKGELLDRLFDRYYQVIVPAIMYAHYYGWSLSATFYASLIITISLWRLTRRVRARKYFAGAPLFLHTIAILTGFYAENPVPPEIMIVLAIMSLLPLKYYRRKASASEKINKGTYFQARTLAVAILIIIPYSRLDTVMTLIHYASITIGLLGWVYFALRGSGSLRERILHSEAEKPYTM